MSARPSKSIARIACATAFVACTIACTDPRPSDSAQHAVARGGEVARAAAPQTTACTATATSLTPASWRVGAETPRAARRSALRVVADVPLPGPANRFDYQSVDPAAGRLYISHMNA